MKKIIFISLLTIATTACAKTEKKEELKFPVQWEPVWSYELHSEGMSSEEIFIKDKSIEIPQARMGAWVCLIGDTEKSKEGELRYVGCVNNETSDTFRVDVPCRYGENANGVLTIKTKIKSLTMILLCRDKSIAQKPKDAKVK